MADLRRRFDEHREPSIGLEEEVFLIDERGLPAPVADEVLARLDGDARFKAELPLAQLEILTEPSPDLPGAIAQLASARRALGDACAGLAWPFAAGAHPLAATAPVRDEGRYGRIGGRFGAVASLQLVAALQIHVAIPGAERSLAAYGALRPLLAPLAALAANAPFFDGHDSGMASVRPLVCGLIPRQGVPPAIDSWDQLERELAWGRAAGAVEEMSGWWWELRLHPAFGTIEVRVPDAQTSIDDAAAIAAVAATLALAGAGSEAEQALPDWRLAENRWLAARGGLEGEQSDLGSGEPLPTREVIAELLARCEPHAEALNATAALEHARSMLAANGAVAQRRLAHELGVDGLPAALGERFRPPAAS